MLANFCSLCFEHGPHSGQRQLLEDALHLFWWVGHISLSKVRKAPARYSETTGRGIEGDRFSAQRVQRAGSIARQSAACKAVLRQAESRFKPARVLDIGCGSGRLLRKVYDSWPEAHLCGVDPAQGMLEVARQLTPEAHFSIGSGEALPLEDASVDLALSTISFHHWQDQAAGLREVARVLRPGGSFLFADFTFPTRYIANPGPFLLAQ